MNSFLNFVASAIVCAVWQLPILVAVTWVVAFLLRRVGAAIEHRVWVGALILCVAVPLISAWHVGLRNGTTPSPDGRVTRTFSAQLGQGPFTQPGVIRMPIHAMELLCGLWLLTAICGALRLVTSLARTKRLLSMAEPCVLDERVGSVWNECRTLMGVSAADLLVSKDLSGPVTLTLTLGSDVLVLPARFSDGVHPEELRAAMLHECAHMRRHDFRKNLGYKVLSLPVQFHPAVWFLRRQLAATREIACDAAVAAAIGDGVAYSDSLLRLATWMSSRAQATPTHAVGIFDANVLEERIMRLRSHKPALPQTIRLVLVGLSTCVFAAGVASALASSVEVAPQGTISGSKPAAAAAVYEVGKDVTAPRLVFQVDPQYSQAARAAKVSGDCLIAFVVDAQGVPREVHVTSGLRPDLDANAVAAVSQYRFAPGLHEGKPVPVHLSVTVNFKIF